MTSSLAANSETNEVRLATLEASVKSIGDEIRKLKSEGADKSIIDEKVGQLKGLKSQLDTLQRSIPKKVPFDRTKFEETVKKRFFYTPSFSIYNGVRGLYDYGPPGCSLQANIIQVWRNHFILEEQMLEVDCTMLTPEAVLKTSGHVDRFTDLMVSDRSTGEFFRADHLLEDWLDKLIKDPSCDPGKKAECEKLLAQIDGFGQSELTQLMRQYEVKAPSTGNDITDPVPFNLMFDTQIGPTGRDKGYLRPETAQGMFVNFKKLLEFNNDKMPFAAAQIGKSFRNEISPRSGLLRVREFTMAEIEHFVHPEKKSHPRFQNVAESVTLRFLPASVQEAGSDKCVEMTVGEAVKSQLVNNETLGYFLARIYLFLTKIGIKRERLRFRQHMSNEMAHYACDCWDAEIESSYGWIECVGCADRSAYDLTRHTEVTKERLVARDALDSPKTVTRLKFIFDRKALGIAFKKDSAEIIKHFESTYPSEADLRKFQAELNVMTDDANIKIITGNGREFSIKKSMVKVEEVSEVFHVDEYIPSVIEPSFGIGRILYSLLEHSYWVRPATATGDDGDKNERRVLSFPAIVAPVKCVVLPLSGHDTFKPFLAQVKNELCSKNVSFQVDDSSSSIGRRYARNDELGIAFAVTVDSDTAQDGTVTLRERDSTTQVRIPIPQLGDTILSLCQDGKQFTWDNVKSIFPVFIEQQTNVLKKA